MKNYITIIIIIAAAIQICLTSRDRRRNRNPRLGGVAGLVDNGFRGGYEVVKGVGTGVTTFIQRSGLSNSDRLSQRYKSRRDESMAGRALRGVARVANAGIEGGVEVAKGVGRGVVTIAAGRDHAENLSDYLHDYNREKHISKITGTSKRSSST